MKRKVVSFIVCVLMFAMLLVSVGCGGGGSSSSSSGGTQTAGISGSGE